MIKTIKEVLILDNGFVKIFNDEVEFPNGKNGNYFKWRMSNANYGVCGAIRTMEGKFILLNQFRYARQETMIESVRGMGENNKTPMECFKQELKEEIGCISSNITYLGESNQDSHTFNVYVFFADNAIIDVDIIDHEETEVISNIKHYSEDEIIQMLKSNQIKDNLTQIALMHALFLK